MNIAKQAKIEVGMGRITCARTHSKNWELTFKSLPKLPLGGVAGGIFNSLTSLLLSTVFKIE